MVRDVCGVTVVSTGKIHFKTHNNSHLSAFSAGVLAYSGATSLKAVHLNGNKSTMQGDFVAPSGEIHAAAQCLVGACDVDHFIAVLGAAQLLEHHAGVFESEADASGFDAIPVEQYHRQPRPNT